MQLCGVKGAINGSRRSARPGYPTKDPATRMRENQVKGTSTAAVWRRKAWLRGPNPAALFSWQLAYRARDSLANQSTVMRSATKFPEKSVKPARGLPRRSRNSNVKVPL